MHGGRNAGEWLGGTFVGAEGGARCHRTDCEEDNIGGFDLDDSWRAIFGEVNLFDCNF